MNSRTSILSRKFSFLLFLLCCGLQISCGLRTAPQFLSETESKLKSTFSDFKVQQRDDRIRLSWKINQDERTDAFSKWYEVPYDNESARSEIFGQANTQYQMLKARLPKTGVDAICKSYEENYDNKIERNEAFSNWYNDQFDNGTEKTDAFSQLDTKQNLQDYFLIQERLIPLHCRDCEIEAKPPLRVLFSSNLFIREGNYFYYYLDLPKNDLNLLEYDVSHIGPDDEILSPVQTVKFRHSNLFPKVPVPILKLVQIEDENQIMRYAFGKVVLRKTTGIDDSKEKLLEQKTEKSVNLEFVPVGNKLKTKSRTFVLRLSWPLFSDKGSKRLQGKGNYFDGMEFYQAYIYRKRNGEEWPETPINSNSAQNNHFLDKLKVDIPITNNKHLKDLNPTISPADLSFYIDLRGQNGDTWSYKLRLIDRFGNESAASETVSFKPPTILPLSE